MGLELLINKSNVLVFSPNCFTIIRLFLPDLFIQVVIKNVKRFIQNGISTSDWSVFITLLAISQPFNDGI